MRWSIAGRSAATAATANHCAAQLWNASSTRTIWVTAVGWSKTVATADTVALKRSTARGATPATTVTPTIANDWEREIIPPSLAVLELALFTTQPTLEGVALLQYSMPAAIASGFILPFETKDLQGIKIIPGAGLCLYTPVATILQPADVFFNIYE
jgi:hypothetical protein